MMDDVPARFAVLRGLPVLSLFVGAAWLLPWLCDALMRRLFGTTPFDAPWMVLHFANVVTAAGLLAAVWVIAATRRIGEATPVSPLPVWTWAAAALAALTFGIAPVMKGASGLSSDIIVAGLLPTTDALAYLTSATHLLSTGQLSEWGTRRPLMSTQLAGILGFTENFRLGVLVLAAGCSAAALLVAAALRASYGLAAACAAIATLFPFIYATLGSTMSENFGFTVGAAGFVLLWHGARRQTPAPCLAGIALLSLGLSARAGAFFVLPMLALWMGWRFAGERRFHWIWSTTALAAGTTGFIVTAILIRTIGAPGQVAFSNFASTLYGLVIGGEPWTRVFVDHPALVNLTEGEQAAAIYRLAFDHALRAPWDPVIGLLSRYNDFLFNLRWHSYVPDKTLRALITALAVIGAVLAVRHRREALPSLLLAALIGVLLSVPFLGDGGSRVFAATHGFTAGLIAFGACYVQRRVSPADRPVLDEPATARAAAFAGVLAIAALAPLSLAITANPMPAMRGIGESSDCQTGELKLATFAVPNGAVSICPMGAASCADGVRAESLVRTDVWKTGQVTALTHGTEPLHITISSIGEGSHWLLARGAQRWPSGNFTACVQKGEWSWLELNRILTPRG